ncbi:glycosyltransferase family 4 protein [Shewanella intestini]|uniref:Glycosyltransferase n=1 Tax=Shewanella intestini TaxID=2017544 RepID=A0ABS5I2F6_9GAMM|nr:MULTISPECIES: glycosyltransferase [Shewanella]MBR9728206.1 glycosyltransferase [Shewanella intestini]MRG35671.1 glycosyltransferase [Shewanella sp. XMDDZSB0408]
MIVSFFHDHIFSVQGDKVFTSGTLDSTLWNRYFVEGVSEVIVCARKKELTESVGKIASKDNIDFVFSPSLSNPLSLVSDYKASVVKNVVKKSDFIVVRLPSEIGNKAVEYAKKFNKKVYCEVVACPFDGLSHYGTILAKMYAPLARHRMKKAVKVADGALYVTKFALQKRYPNSKLTMNASNVELREVLKESEVEINRLDRFSSRKKSRELKVGLIGTVKNDSKGVDIAIKGLVGLGVQLHVIGSGNPERYEKLAKDSNVKFCHDGFIIDKDEVFEWLDDIDIYIQPSFQEGLPRATIEAMSRGCPVLSSNAGGLEELTLPQFVHKSGDYSKFRSDMLDLIEKTCLNSVVYHSLNEASKYTSNKLESARYEFYTKAFSK